MSELKRRAFLTGVGAIFITAPAIVRASSLMPVKLMKPMDLTYYVGNGRHCSDLNPGTMELPFRTVWHAFDAIYGSNCEERNVTVYLLEGVYE